MSSTNADESSTNEVGEMKKGDYMIHVFIQQSRALKIPDQETVDPIIKVKCLGKYQFTKEKDDIGVNNTVSWNEHIFFEPKDLSQAQIEDGKIEIKVQDKRLFKDALIGIYSFDIPEIYFAEKHAIFHQWVALSNPSSAKFTEITGYLKISISVITSGDEQVELAEDSTLDTGEKSIILVPPYIHTRYFQLKFRIFAGECFPDLDYGSSTCDAFIRCSFMNKTLETKVVPQKDDKVDWSQEMWIPAQMPIASPRLHFKLYDYDGFKSNEIVASMRFNVEKYLKILDKGGEFPIFWRNLYGAPLGVTGDHTDEMNSNPEYASLWKGRVLMQVVAEETDTPTLKICQADGQAVNDSYQYRQPREYQILFQIPLGIALPGKHRYYIKLKIGNFELVTNKPQKNHYSEGYCFWNYRAVNEIMTCPYLTVEDMERVYIYLMHDDEAICYWRGEADDFTNPCPEMRWVPLVNDLSVGDVQNAYEAGIISFRLYIHDKHNQGELMTDYVEPWNHDLPTLPYKYKARAYIYQCSGLPSSDKDGNCDPLVEVWSPSDQKPRTQVVEDNTNPVFYETVEFDYYVSEDEVNPPFILSIKDKDDHIVSDTYDFVGRSLIPYKDASVSISPYDNLEPKWHSIKMGYDPDEPEMGRILVSFSLIEYSDEFMTPVEHLDITPESTVYNIEINILGLRNLQSPGILPVKKAFIKFDIRSLMHPSKATAIENIKTHPQSSGPNPTISTVIKFNCELPIDDLYTPAMTCSVFDNVFKGFRQPLIGNFHIPIGDLQHRHQERMKTQKAKTIDIIKQLNYKMDNIDEQIDKINQEKQRVKLLKQVLDIRNRTSQGSFGEILRRKHSPDKIDIEPISTTQFVANETDDENETLLVKEEEEKVGASRDETTFLSRRPEQMMISDSSQEKINGEGSASDLNPVLKLMKDNDKLFGKRDNSKDLLNKLKEKKDLIKSKSQKKRQDLEDIMADEDNAVGTNVIMPKYKFDNRLKISRECDKPPKELYIGVSFDPTPESKQKHYRKYYEDELENIKEIMPKSPFQEYEIKRGQSRGLSKSWFFKDKVDDSGQVSSEKVVGEFKAIVTVENLELQRDFDIESKKNLNEIKSLLSEMHLKVTGQEMDYDYKEILTNEGKEKFNVMMKKINCRDLEIQEHLQSIQRNTYLNRSLLRNNKCIVRVYVISAFDLAKRDNGSHSDPYIMLKCNKTKFSERDNYQTDEPNPGIHKYFDFEATFPGCSPLKIQFWDYDLVFGDDFIGETFIDLEDRYFSLEWQGIKEKPIEYRQLYHPSSKVAQGVVKLWVEIHPLLENKATLKAWSIKPRPPQELEARVVIWGTKGLQCYDWEGTTDAFIRCFFDSTENAKETDTHWRCQDGKASFNYRLKFNLTNPGTSGILNLQVWDRDIFKSNDHIADASINISEAIKDATVTGRPICFNKKYIQTVYKSKMQSLKISFSDEDEDSIWIHLNNEKSDAGKVRIQVDIVPKARAEANPVGSGRDNPNHSPFCPPPVGRIKWSMNPFTMLNQCVGREVRMKLYMLCCCVFILILCASAGPFIFGSVLSEMLNPFNYINASK